MHFQGPWSECVHCNNNMLATTRTTQVPCSGTSSGTTVQEQGLLCLIATGELHGPRPRTPDHRPRVPDTGPLVLGGHLYSSINFKLSHVTAFAEWRQLLIA